jgi:acyl carrier protein
MLQGEEVQLALKDFILKEFLPDEDPDELQWDTELVSTGILDSVSTLRVIAFVEERYAVEIQAHEANIQNLNSIAAMAELVRSKRGSKRAS